VNTPLQRPAKVVLRVIGEKAASSLHRHPQTRGSALLKANSAAFKVERRSALRPPRGAGAKRRRPLRDNDRRRDWFRQTDPLPEPTGPVSQRPSRMGNTKRVCEDYILEPSPDFSPRRHGAKVVRPIPCEPHHVFDFSLTRGAASRTGFATNYFDLVDAA
jgi:hypothetical protein